MDSIFHREIVLTIELDPIVVDEGLEPFRFRLEIGRRVERTVVFGVKVYRLETYRVRPTFPSRTINELCDAQILVLDESHDWGSITAHSPEEVRDLCLSKIRSIFYPP